MVIIIHQPSFSNSRIAIKVQNLQQSSIIANNPLYDPLYVLYVYRITVNDPLLPSLYSPNPNHPKNDSILGMAFVKLLQEAELAQLHTQTDVSIRVRS